MKKFKAIFDTFRMVKDQWKNTVTGVGGSKDPTRQLTYGQGAKLTEAEADNLFRFNWIAKRAVTKVPEIALAKGYTIEGVEEDLAEKITDRLKTFKINSVLKRALIESRVSGSSYIMIGALDGNLVEEPVNKKMISRLAYFHVFSRGEVTPFSYNNDPESPDYGLTAQYFVTPYHGGNSFVVHASRMIKIDSTFMTNYGNTKENFQADSVLDAANESMKRIGISLQTAVYLIQDFVSKVLKIKNFDEQMQDAETIAGLKERIQLQQETNAVWSINIIDSEEEYQKIGTPVTGIPDIIKILVKEVSAAVKIPESVLFGESLGQLSGAEASIDNFYDEIQNFQENDLKDIILELVEFICLDRTFLNNALKLDIKFNPLRNMTLKEQLENEKSRAESFKIYLDSGVISVEEIRKSIKKNNLNLTLDDDDYTAISSPPEIENE